ncbi:MAG: PQQ-binding-like beta-propeller repeat protein [Gemmataceae bacterium]
MTWRPAMMMFLLWSASAMAADSPRLLSENRRTIERCDEAADLERQGKWDDALAAYIKIANEAGDDLIPTDASRTRWLPVRVLLFDRISGRQELRDRYRARFEADADRAVDQAIQRRDRQQLERIASNFGPTRSAARGYETLGDLDFEAGDFASARRYWTQASRSDSVAIPLLRAKCLMASAAAGESTEKDLEDFSKQFPDAQGTLGGRKGVLVELLREGNHSSAQLTNAQSPSLPDAAPRKLYAPIPLTFDPSGEDEPNEPSPILRRQKRPTLIPTIWQGHILLNDGLTISAFDLTTGKQADAFALAQSGRVGIEFAPSASHFGEAISVNGSRVFARLGRPGKTETHLVCLERGPAQKGLRWRSLWELRASEVAGPGEGRVDFDGCPIVDDGKLFCSWTRVQGNRATITVAALPAETPSKGPLWTRAIVELPVDARLAGRPLLLVHAGPNVIVSTEAGLVVALDAQSGRVAWAVQYPSRGPHGVTADLMPVPRDVAPAVAANGRVFLAPFDSGEVFALDAWTGEPVWPRPLPLETVHLFGVAGQRLIVTASGLRNGIAAIDLVTGHLIADWGSLEADRPLGRGLIAGDRVLWPTSKQGLRILKLDGSLEYPPAAFFNLPGGNVAFADGYLVLATAEHLHVFKYSGQLAQNDAPETKFKSAAKISPSKPMPAQHPSSLDIQWHVDLPSDETPRIVGDGLLLLSRGRHVVARQIPSGAKQWDAEQPEPLDWLERRGEVVFIGGRYSLAALSLGGEEHWSVRTPEKQPLSHFSVNQDVVVARVGDGAQWTWKADNGKFAGEKFSQIDDVPPLGNGESIGDASVENGRMLRSEGMHRWKCELPAIAEWQVHSLGSAQLLVFMKAPVWSWAESAGSPYQWSAVLVNRKTGKLESQCKLPAQGPTLATGLHQNYWVVVLPGGVWGFPLAQSEAR